MAQVKITLTKSINRAKKDQVATVRALGLHKIRSTVVKEDNDAIRGMIAKVSHLVSSEAV
jgi:large subunit ribosomal protein L30